MEVRGVRECQACETRWSYFETGSLECPACGSMRSIGVGDRELHTGRPVELDLTRAREVLASGSVREAADPAGEAALEYIRGRGFINAGDLQPLSDTYVAAHEVRHAAAELGRTLTVSDEEAYYFGELLEGAARGDRPGREDVPASLHVARGLAAAAAVRAYRDALRTWVGRESTVEEAATLTGSLGDHVRRIKALDGAVEPAEADRLVAAAKALGDYLRSEAETDLERCRTLLENLGGFAEAEG